MVHAEGGGHLQFQSTRYQTKKKVKGHSSSLHLKLLVLNQATTANKSFKLLNFLYFSSETTIWPQG